MLFLWFCVYLLQSLRLGLQSFLSRIVAGVVSLSKNPILLPEIAIRYIHLKIINRLYHLSGVSEAKLNELRKLESRYAAIRNTTYDKDVYRRSIGLGVLVVIVLLFAYALIYFFTLD
jgi:hypothetical protein